MKKINLLNKFLIASITLCAANFTFANEQNHENNLHLDKLAFENLPHLNAQKKVSVAGLSSGGFMANQYQIAYSNDVSSVAIIAGGSYFCAENSFQKASTTCINPTAKNMLPTPKQQQTIIKNFADKNLIDNPDNLKNHKVWLYTSKNDKSVVFSVMDNLNDFYNDIVYQDKQLADKQKQFIVSENAGHAWISNLAKNACETHKVSPFINYCNGYDSAENYLQFFFPNQVSNDKNNSKNNTNLKNINGRFIKFSQSDLQKKYNIQNAEMANEGFAFIPKQCESKDSIEKSTCAIHFVLHGCHQSYDMIDEQFIYQTGVWQYAEKYNLVLVYPQTKKSEKNPNSCWDWFGYSGENYTTKQAAQLKTFDAIVKELQSK